MSEVKTEVQHEVSFKVVTRVDLDSMQESMQGFVERVNASKEAGEEVSDFAQAISDAVTSGELAKAVEMVVTATFSEFLIATLGQAAQMTTTEMQSTEFVDVQVRPVAVTVDAVAE